MEIKNLSELDEISLVETSRMNALATFQKASTRVPRYRSLLEEKGIDFDRIVDYTSFQELPVIDKKSYLAPNQNDFELLCLDGNLNLSNSIVRSSGHSGQPLYWPRLPDQQQKVTKRFERLYLNIFKVDQVSTLVVITTDLGMWGGGVSVANAFKNVAKAYPMCVVTPGLRPKEAMDIITEVGHKFDQVSIVGYPPFIKRLIEKGSKAGFAWPKINPVFLAGGEGFSEQWRDYILEISGKRGSFSSVIGSFGSSECAVFAFESPLSILVRRLADEDASIRKELFSSQGNVYSLVQYDPRDVFLETNEDGDLIVTVDGCLPLVRYNTKDVGGLLTFDRIITGLSNCGYDALALLENAGIPRGVLWKLPYLFTFGRRDGVSINGCIVYVENVENAFLNPALRGVNNFKVAAAEDSDRNQRLLIHVELEGGYELGQEESQSFRDKCHDVILSELLRVDDDFSSSYEDDPASSDPVIEIHRLGHGPFVGEEKRIKQKHVL